MSDARPVAELRTLKIACGALVGCAAVLFLWRGLDARLWMDELLTLILVQAPSLSKLWAGVIGGMDGNPPLYFSLAWLIAQSVPPGVSLVVVLRLVNVLATVAAVFALYRVSRRVASAHAAWIGVFLFLATNENVFFVALELRTYAMYFLMAALAILCQQRLIEQGRRSDLILLGLCYVGLTLIQTFGIAYVVSIALAGWLSRLGGGWRHARPLVVAAIPAAAIMACWSPFLLGQSQVAQPYNWIEAPDTAEFIRSIFPSPAAAWLAALELYGIGGFLIWTATRRRWPKLLSLLFDERWQPCRYPVLVVLGMLGVAASVWIMSQIMFPLFVFRYLMPQMAISLAIHVGFCVMALHLLRDLVPAAAGRIRAAAVILAPLLFCAVLLVQDPVRAANGCADSSGTRDLEADHLPGDLPVIAESPHIFLPRIFYSAQPAAYRFPLDWDVVLNYPTRSRGNATDFQLMKRIKAWAHMTSIMTTEDIIAAYPQFLVLEMSGRAWFYNLRNTRDVTAEKLAERTSPGGDTCTLWKVTSVRQRPSPPPASGEK